MRRITFVLSSLLLCIPLLVCGKPDPGVSHSHDHEHTQHGMEHSFADVEKYAERFESPERAAWQKPDEVVQAMDLKAGDWVADIGAGTGYFTRRFARVVAPSGSAYALDVEEGMVDYALARAKKEGLSNLRARVIDASEPRLERGGFDVIFLCNVYHHISGRSDYFRRLIPALKPGGRLVIVDFKKEEAPVGPPLKHKLARDVVVSELKAAGFVLAESKDFLPHQYFLIFKPKTDPAPL